ncbi:MAG: class I SAM-dependent methyltransferase [Dehalococcoidia bacterium]|nr:class I SAM-dependent methyltransferase [Dehalococcoidia bacterium]
MTESTTAERIQRLLSPERRERLDVPRILSLLSLRPYLTVADIGCGPGLFTLPLAKSLWDGKVYAVDVEEEMLEAVRTRAVKARLGNITTLKSDGAALPLEPGSVDGALLCCVLHEAADKGALLKGIVAAMKRGGWCAIIEWKKAMEGSEGPPQEHRIAEEDVLQLAKDAGLRLSMRRDLNSYHYLLVLIK